MPLDKQNIKTFFREILIHKKSWLTNFYLLSTIVFVLWMTFFDANDWIDQWRMSSKLSELEQEKVYYQTMIKELEVTRKSLLNDPELLERFARERYMMKRPEEEIFIIEYK